MKRLCSALLVLAMAGCGGVDVQGIVRDERTGEPLPGAKVMIGDEETATDYRGFFELEVDEDEASEMRVGKSGYETHTGPVSLEDDIDEIIRDVELAPAGSMNHDQEGLPEDGSLERTDDGLLNPDGSNMGTESEGTESEGTESEGTESEGTESEGTQPGTQPPAGWTPKENWEPSDDQLRPRGKAPQTTPPLPPR